MKHEVYETRMFLQSAAHQHKDGGCLFKYQVPLKQVVF